MVKKGWTLEKSLWEKIPKNLRRDGKKWRSVLFNSLEASVVPPKPGIYLLCSSPPDRSRLLKISSRDLFGLLYTPIYIGRTENLQRRFKNHTKTPPPDIKQARECFTNNIYFWWTELDKSLIVDVERDFIDCLGPPANKKEGDTIQGKIQDPVPA